MNKNILNFINQLQNASKLQKEEITVNYTKLILQFVSVLYKEGLIQSYFISHSQNAKIIIKLRYYFNQQNLENIKIFSTSLNLKYSEICKIPKYQRFIFSTSYGFLTNVECIKNKVGGILYLKI